MLWLDHVRSGIVKFLKSWLWTLRCWQIIHHFFFSYTWGTRFKYIFAKVMPLHTHLFSFTHNAVVLSHFRCVHSENQTKIFWFFTFYKSKQISLTQDLRWSLEQSIALQLQRQTDLLLCTVNCFPQWAHPQNMAIGHLAFYYTLYLWVWVTNDFIRIHNKTHIPSVT